MTRITLFGTTLMVSLLVACASQQQQASDTTARTGDTSTMAAAPGDSGWRPLFDGRTLNGWRAYRGTTASSAWTARDGVLAKAGSAEDIISGAQFGDFELAFDWKLSPGGNAGVFYRATEEYDHVYWSGPEYQLLDDVGHPDAHSRLTAAGAAYALYPSPAGVVKPAGEWNSARIVVRGAHVEHWMNGTKLLEYELWSPDWEAKVKASKFGEWPNYGRATRGHIGIQGDHDGALALRNIRIRELNR